MEVWVEMSRGVDVARSEGRRGLTLDIHTEDDESDALGNFLLDPRLPLRLHVIMTRRKDGGLTLRKDSAATTEL